MRYVLKFVGRRDLNLNVSLYMSGILKYPEYPSPEYLLDA